MNLFRTSAKEKYRDRSKNIGAMFRSDSPALRIVIFIVMSAIFFLFLKVTEKKIPSGLAPDSSTARIQDTSRTK